MLDVPIYGRIATIELFRPHVSQRPIPSKAAFCFVWCDVSVGMIPYLFPLFQNEAQDFLFVATERYKFCVLQWDAEKSELLTRYGLFMPLVLLCKASA